MRRSAPYLLLSSIPAGVFPSGACGADEQYRRASLLPSHSKPFTTRSRFDVGWTCLGCDSPPLSHMFGVLSCNRSRNASISCTLFQWIFQSGGISRFRGVLTSTQPFEYFEIPSESILNIWQGSGISEAVVLENASEPFLRGGGREFISSRAISQGMLPVLPKSEARNFSLITV